MKIYLIAALFLAALVVAHTNDIDLPEQDVELPEQPEQQDQPDEELNDPTEEDEIHTSETEVDDVENVEDPEKRRRKNTLSNRSCLRLKRGGYCRHLFISRLCAAACDPCLNYKTLNQLSRRRSRQGGVLKCDRGGFANRWYRFTGLAGTKMPTRAPPTNRCGTHAPGWMKGSYPRGNGQVVSRRVCFHWSGNECYWHTQIKVKRCRWGRSYYYVFKLGPTPACHLRYCGNS